MVQTEYNLVFNAFFQQGTPLWQGYLPAREGSPAERQNSLKGRVNLDLLVLVFEKNIAI